MFLTQGLVRRKYISINKSSGTSDVLGTKEKECLENLFVFFWGGALGIISEPLFLSIIFHFILSIFREDSQLLHKRSEENTRGNRTKKYRS